MPSDLPEALNPFEAPRASIGAEALSLDLADHDAELIRREHLGREANVKSLGRLGYAGAAIAGLFAIVMAVMASGAVPLPQPQGRQQDGLDPALGKIFVGMAALFYAIAAVILGGVGYGLVRLQAWARWTTVVLSALALAYVAFVALFLSFFANPAAGVGVGVIGGGIFGLVITLLATGKSGMVFSGEYREVIRKTPHVRQETSLAVKILLGVLIACILMAVLGAIIDANR